MNIAPLKHITEAILDRYPVKVSSLAFFAHETSILYKVADDKGEEFALKIYDDQSSQVEDNRIEVLMIEAIRQHGIISVAEILHNQQGQSISIYTDPSTGRRYRIVLSKWLSGTDFQDNESKELFIALGRAVADLHEATVSVSLPKDLQPKRWDQVFYFRDEKAVYQEARYFDQTTPEFKEVMDRAVDQLNTKLSHLWAIGEPQLLHGDLNPWNIKVHADQFTILDFEDAIFGPPLQDLAILLYYYQAHASFSYESVKNWIFEGYTSKKTIAGWDDQHIEWLIMARKVNFLNYVLTLEGDYQAYIEKGLALLKSFLADQT